MRPLAVLLVLGLTALPVAAAAPMVQDEVGRLQVEFRDEQARARRLRAEAADAAAEIGSLQQRLAALRGEVGSGDARITAQRARLNELGAREAALVAQLAQAQGRQTRLLSALQTLSRHPPPPLLVPADKAIDTVRASILMRAIAPELQARSKGLADRQGELQRIRRLAALNSEQLFTAESARGDQRAEIESLTRRQVALRAVLGAEAQAAERAAGVLERRLRTLGARVPAGDPETPSPVARRPAGRDRLTPPIDGAPSVRFGGGSAGWRWRADALEARAPAAARVAYAGPLEGWGQVVILDLGPGWSAVVAGLAETSVQTGARVADGQALGRSAADGEIVFELRREERPIDPAPFLK